MKKTNSLNLVAVLFFSISFLTIFNGFSQSSEFYGMTIQGGTDNAGTIFKTDENGENHQLLWSFPNTSVEGVIPYGSLFQSSNGKLYGMTSSGGDNNDGVIFEFDPVSNSYLKVFNFNDAISGNNPRGSLVEATNGKLYGMTYRGGTSNVGVLFEFDPALSTYAKKIDFSGSNGESPLGSLVLASNGKLYGITTQGGSSDMGVLFEFTPSTNSFVVKHNFNSTASYSSGSLIEASNGKLYGMTVWGGTGNGTIFEFNPVTSSFLKIHDFDNTNGKGPNGSLLQVTDGNLYGMTGIGGANNYGVFFQYNLTTNTFTKKFDFNGTPKGSLPYRSLIQGSNGLIYGMARTGGAYGHGVIFEYSPSSSTFIKKWDFDGTNGKQPHGSLIAFNIPCIETTNIISPTECTTYTVPSGDETYTISGTYMDTIPNVGGCDSVLTINLTINNSTTGTDVISACGSHSWIDGNFYTSSNNTATHTLNNSVGCDSVVTLNLTILPLSNSFINVTACDSYTVPSGDETYTASGNYLDTLVNSMGCDSAIIITLTIINSTSGSENITACDSYTWSANTTTYTASGSYTATLVNSAGCDSTATLNLTITNSTAGSENVTACDSYIWSANTITYSASGSYTTTLVNSAGCDSTATLNLTINNSNSGSENATACETYVWPANGTNYTASGSYSATLTNVNGCDSIATLNLTIEIVDNTVSQVGIVLTANATGYSYQWVDCDNGNADVTGETNQSFTPTLNGNYAVEISSATCTEISACTVINSVGIEVLEELGVKIYPNPSTGEFNIAVTANASIEIANVLGAIVHQQNIAKGNNSIDISSQPNGLYFIYFTINKVVYTHRIVLEK